MALVQIEDQSRLIRTLGNTAWRDARELAHLPDTARRGFDTLFAAVPLNASDDLTPLLQWVQQFHPEFSEVQARALQAALVRRAEEVSAEKSTRDLLIKALTKRGSGPLHRALGHQSNLKGSAYTEVAAGWVYPPPPENR